MYVCMCTHVFVHVCTCMCMHTYLPAHVSVHCLHVCTCAGACVYMCVCVRVHTRARVSLHGCACVHACSVLGVPWSRPPAPSLPPVDE